MNSTYLTPSDASPTPPEPPEALGELSNTGVAILREVFKGRASGGVDAPSNNSPFPSEDGRGTCYVLPMPGS